ncbi:hypothetical protein EYC84_009655 [Monilinia fructicola]|uniref:Uncharacterized protein n=1 Tax=Monilinia fructicola TaxID=38448 RepID=A0A5M9JF85_MONFR|nr:hypothetical protein EYC84_009655 [Monilinia fructicola]
MDGTSRDCIMILYSRYKDWPETSYFTHFVFILCGDVKIGRVSYDNCQFSWPLNDFKGHATDAAEDPFSCFGREVTMSPTQLEVSWSLIRVSRRAGFHGFSIVPASHQLIRYTGYTTQCTSSQVQNAMPC